MSSYVLWGQLWQLMWLGVYPTQWFHLFEVLMLWQLGWQVYGLMSAPLWCHHNASDFLYLRIIRWTATIQISSNLKHVVIDCEFFSATKFVFVSAVLTICTYSLSQAIAHVVNHKLLTTKAQIQTQGSPSGICGGQSASGFSPTSCHSTIDPNPGITHSNFEAVMLVDSVSGHTPHPPKQLN